MFLERTIHLRQKQGLHISAQTIQALRMLRLGQQDLSSYLEEQAERNPLIEVRSAGLPTPETPRAAVSASLPPTSPPAAAAGPDRLAPGASPLARCLHRQPHQQGIVAAIRRRGIPVLPGGLQRPLPDQEAPLGLEPAGQPGPGAHQGLMRHFGHRRAVVVQARGQQPPVRTGEFGGQRPFLFRAVAPMGPAPDRLALLGDMGKAVGEEPLQRRLMCRAWQARCRARHGHGRRRG